MGSCCQEKSCDLAKLRKEQAKVLWIVLAVNAVMFFVEFGSGLIAHSLALTSDSLDMLGDAIAYGSSLYVINKGRTAKAWSATLKGSIMLVSALAVLAQAVWKLTHQVQPEVTLMSGVTLLALLANSACLVLLTRHRSDDVNMSSVWICSRNDLIANTSVLAAAGLVFLTNSQWPDFVVGLGITALFLKSGIGVLRKARQELAQQRAVSAPA
ncbi:MAG: cation transporter [Proteobacteria bacterium]|nr:cation transporter [Pseudomonadota bacterium]